MRTLVALHPALDARRRIAGLALGAVGSMGLVAAGSSLAMVPVALPAWGRLRRGP